jgi:hypothetical protein
MNKDPYDYYSQQNPNTRFIWLRDWSNHFAGYVTVRIATWEHSGLKGAESQDTGMGANSFTTFLPTMPPGVANYADTNPGTASKGLGQVIWCNGTADTLSLSIFKGQSESEAQVKLQSHETLFPDFPCSSGGHAYHLDITPEGTPLLYRTG